MPHEGVLTRAVARSQMAQSFNPAGLPPPPQQDGQEAGSPPPPPTSMEMDNPDVFGGLLFAAQTELHVSADLVGKLLCLDSDPPRSH